MRRMLAVKIVAENLQFIALLNDNVEPNLDFVNNYYFVTNLDAPDTCIQRIMNHNEFFSTYPNASTEATIQTLLKP